jgi:uncharacterized protein
VLNQLGLHPGEPFVVARPGPEGATYHQFENPLFDRALAYLLRRQDARVVLLPRRPQDVRAFASVPADRQIVPDRAVDTRSLLSYATAMLGAGGTMNREAALLGTPVFGMYAGRLAALDQLLIREGKLRPLSSDPFGFEAELSELSSRGRNGRRPPRLDRHVLDRFLEAITTPVAR